ncbi:flagellar cap protein FliD N-terminal domain-containing protein [Cohnella phaseoli]|uniref:flagellar cap protein FliD N-terminal domain-containing protein n=1 Tax=Cohnella phaseoli TaxID=456490 RepID=UPI0011C04A15
MKCAQDIQGSAQKIMQNDHSSFHTRTAESSDSKRVTATASGGAASKSYEVKVNAIATAQMNRGTLLSEQARPL